MSEIQNYVQQPFLYQTNHHPKVTLHICICILRTADIKQILYMNLYYDIQECFREAKQLTETFSVVGLRENEIQSVHSPRNIDQVSGKKIKSFKRRTKRLVLEITIK